ncbi:MAG: group II intron reverse transcriptase/maturase [Planctomycetes bacterium]|nr:group II intron reverse transcriptase/maturase [Planctomycetota bacterium]
MEEFLETLEGKRVPLPRKVALLRRKLGRKAKLEPRFRFYAMYDRIYHRDVLAMAWDLVRVNGGAPGVDGVRIEDILKAEGNPEDRRPKELIEDIRNSLLNKTYRPGPVLRVYIEKENGKLRPLGIPNVIDRVVQTAALLILEPIFEADFEGCSYGFRPGRSAHQALAEVRRHLQGGYREVYDADLKGYFDSIPWGKLMACVRMRVVDGNVLNLIRMWLQAPVVERDSKGRKVETHPQQGTPQGGVISPLLANIYLHWFDKVFHRNNGPAHWANAKLVRYADDFVALARHQSKRLVDWMEGKLEGWLGLSVNREKTKVVTLKANGESLNFLSYTFRFDRSLYGTGRRYLNVEPSKKAVAKERRKLRELISREMNCVPIPTVIQMVNRQVGGWANYFSFGYPRKACRRLNWFMQRRLGRHLRRRSQRPYKLPKDTSMYVHLKELGLHYL